MRGRGTLLPRASTLTKEYNMKKYSIFGLLAVMSLGFAACDNYEEPNPAPQTNPQTSVLQTSDVTVASKVVAQAYNLKALNDENSTLLVSDITVPNMPEGYTFKAVAQVSADGFASSYECPMVVEQVDSSDVYNVSVAPDELQGVYFENISHNPAEAKVAVRYALYTVSGKQEARVGGPDTFYGPFELSIVPFPASKVIEDAYYLVGTASDGTVAKAVKFQHSDVNPYDDPVFSAKFDVTPDWQWQIIPQSTFAAGTLDGNTVYGVVTGLENELEGDLLAVADGGVPGVLTESYPYLLTINMDQLTYSFSLAIEQLYTPGNSNGWSQTASQILTTTDYVTYTGYAYLNGEYKFSTAPNWDGTNFGSTGVEGELTNDGGAGNLNAAAAGLYWLSVNISNLTYSAVLCNTYGMIGDATPNGWDASTALTPSADFLTWTATVTLKDGEFKFRANDAWDVNLGGAMNNLVPNGDNIKSPGAGTYEVTLDFTQVPYTCKLVKK